MLDLREITPDMARPIRRHEYERMVEVGLFEDDHVELLDGVIVRMSPHGPEHDGALERLTEILVTRLRGRARVRIQSSFAASDASEPEPDVAVVPLRDYDDAHPSEAWLVVEVAHSSLKTDLGPKARVYAESGVEEYWVVNLVDDRIDVFSDPAAGSFRSSAQRHRGEAIRLRHFPDVEVAVSDVLRKR